MVTWEQVQTTLGRPLTEHEKPQADLWIDHARLIIHTRLGDLAALDQHVLDFVVVEAVARRLRHPAEERQVSVTIDDGTVAKTYQSSSGLIEILPEWWDMLTANPASLTDAFSVTPHYRSGARVPDAEVWP